MFPVNPCIKPESVRREYASWALNSWHALGLLASRDKYQEAYNVKMGLDRHGNVNLIIFNSEEEAVLFILRWS